MENQLQVPAKQENRELVNLCSQIIKVDPPFQSCKEEVLRQSLAYGLTLCGISPQNMPSKLEREVLVDFVKSNYPDYTQGELKYAFSKAMARKFGPGLDAKCYGSFSCEYVGRVLEAYQSWNNGDYSVFNSVLYDINPNELRESVQHLYQQYLKGEILDHYPKAIYYQFVYDHYITPLDGTRAHRVYPKQMEIKRVFNTLAINGASEIYIFVEGRMIENKISSAS